MKIHLSELKRQKQYGIYTVIDLFMLFLVVLNLSWMILDWNFNIPIAKEFLFHLFPSFSEYYLTYIHPHFFEYDLIFVGIFISELLIRWIISIFRDTYFKWWFYPFIHWYDTLGCIPMGTFRVLRLVRVYSMIMRLQKKGIIDITNTGIYKLLKVNSNIIAEELSDKVVENVIYTTQDQILNENTLQHKIMDEVILPKKEWIAEAIYLQVQLMSNKVLENTSEHLEEFVKTNVNKAFHENQEVKNLEKIPMVGKQISKTLESSVGDITYKVIEAMITSLAKQDNRKMIHQFTHAALDNIEKQNKENQELEKLIKQIIVDSLDVINEEVSVKKWKTRQKI